MKNFIDCIFLNGLIFFIIFTTSLVKSEFKCLNDGLFEDPDDCRMYYECLWIGSAFEKVEHLMCPEKLIYNSKKHRCDNLLELDNQISTNGIKTSNDLHEYMRFKNCFKLEIVTDNEKEQDIQIGAIINKLNIYLNERDSNTKLIFKNNFDYLNYTTSIVSKKDETTKYKSFNVIDKKFSRLFPAISKRVEPKINFLKNSLDSFISFKAKKEINNRKFNSSITNSSSISNSELESKNNSNINIELFNVQSFNKRTLLSIEDVEEEEASNEEDNEETNKQLEYSIYQTSNEKSRKANTSTTSLDPEQTASNNLLIDSIEQILTDRAKMSQTEKHVLVINSTSKIILRDATATTKHIVSSNHPKINLTTKNQKEIKTNSIASDIAKYFSTYLSQNLNTQNEEPIQVTKSNLIKSTEAFELHVNNSILTSKLKENAFYTTTVHSKTTSRLPIPAFTIRNTKNSTNEIETLIGLDYEDIKPSKLKSQKYQRLSIAPEDTLIECKENDFGLECSCSITLSPPKCKGLINSFLSSCKILGCKNNGKCISISYKYPIPYVCSCPGTFMGTYCEIARDKIDSTIKKKTHWHISTTKRSPAKKFYNFEKASQSTRKIHATKKYSFSSESQVDTYNSEFKEPVCYPNPCLNRGNCIIVGSRFECRCLNSSYSGKYCEIYTYATTKSPNYSFFRKKFFTVKSSNPNYATGSTTTYYNRLWQCPSSCHNNLGHGFCTLDASSNPKCVCNGDWTGPDCNQKNYCLYNRCMNNSTCINHPASRSYVCLCPLTHSGNYCEIKLKITDFKYWNEHEFDEINKQKNDTLVENNETPKLEYDEKLVDSDYDSDTEKSRMVPVERLIKSSSQKCKNNGTYVKSSSECKCKQGYWGKKCEFKNNACNSNPCNYPTSDCIPIGQAEYDCVCNDEIDEDCIEKISTTTITTPTTTKYAKKANSSRNNSKKLITKASLKKNTKTSKSTTTTTITTSTPIITTTTTIPVPTFNLTSTRINENKNKPINPCNIDNELCLKYPNGNESFICVPNLSLEYNQCLPAKSLNCFEMNPCLNGGLCIQNDDLSFNFRQQEDKNIQSVNFKCICKDNFTGQLCESEICSPVRALMFNHTMCSSVSPNLISEDVSISNSDINLIINIHNNIRRQVIPSSSNMQKMYWDKQLEILAQKRAQMCSAETGGILNRQQPGYGVVIGENLAAGYEKWVDVIESWVNENASFAFKSNSTSENLQTGHLTQIIYSSASRIGCGFAQCTNSDYNSYFVCYYGEMQTHVARYEPYIEGESCSMCKNNCDNGLCDCKGMYCHNGGKIDLSTCSCQCPYSTFTGRYCENVICPIEDSHFCSKALFEQKCWLYPVIRATCPYMCRLCKKETDNSNSTIYELNSNSLNYSDLQKLIENTLLKY